MVMMTQESDQPVSHPVSVVDPRFVTPCQLEIIVDKFSIGALLITDINQKIMIKVKPCDTRFHRQRVLLDANDRPIVILREKSMSVHGQWNVFKGESKADSDMIFSTKTEHMIQFQYKTSVKVLLANKVSSKDDCDFMFKGSWSKRNCAIFMGGSSTTIANMHAFQPSENTKFCKDKFMVTINPNVDYAFVVAIIAIVDALKNHDKKLVAAVVGGDVGTVVDVIGAFSSS